MSPIPVGFRYFVHEIGPMTRNPERDTERSRVVRARSPSLVRGEKQSGFPKATTGILDWFQMGVCKELEIALTDPAIASDNDDIIATLRL